MTDLTNADKQLIIIALSLYAVKTRGSNILSPGEKGTLLVTLKALERKLETDWTPEAGLLADLV